MVQSARPLRTSRSSLPSNGWIGARRIVTASGERKEHLLQSCRALAAAHAKLVERADPAHPAVREQHEAVADALGVAQLMHRENEGAPAAGHVAQHGHDLARLPQIEAVER